MPLPLSPQVFAITTRLIEDAAGLHYDARDADILAEKLSSRAAERELDSLLDYYYFLRYDPEGPRELELLIETLVVNETYFFREADQLRALARIILPSISKARPSLRIWCAACSTGEEALTLAMILEEHDLLARTEIVASDISTRVLGRAEAGIYGGRALRVLDPRDRLRYFVENADGTVRVRRDLVERVRFRRVNLFDPDRVRALGRFDVILCRNALIYFRDETVVSLVGRFADSLEPAGLLLVGASESLLRFGTVLACEEHGGAFFYRKVAE